jgi:hypothetical protein
MANIVPVTRERHAGKGWRGPANFSFAAEVTVVPLGWSEFPHAAAAMPIGFIEQAGHYMPVALLSLAKGKNLFVEPTTKQWVGHYIPAMLRVHPFYLVREERTEQSNLSIDEDAGLVVDEGGENVVKFFEPDGSLSQPSSAILAFLRQIEQERTKIDLAVAALAEAGVIKPWPLSVPVGDQNITMSGFNRIDDAVLNGLGDDQFLKLRKASALLIAYAQLVSMWQVPLLGRLALLAQGMAQAAERFAQHSAKTDLLPI